MPRRQLLPRRFWYSNALRHGDLPLHLVGIGINVLRFVRRWPVRGPDWCHRVHGLPRGKHLRRGLLDSDDMPRGKLLPRELCFSNSLPFGIVLPYWRL